jgi:hypothetical protein
MGGQKPTRGIFASSRQLSALDRALYALTLDCKDPYELAKFYAALLKWECRICLRLLSQLKLETLSEDRVVEQDCVEYERG